MAEDVRAVARALDAAKQGRAGVCIAWERLSPAARDALLAEGDFVLRALTAAGLAVYDTKTHAAVPREPTEAMMAKATNLAPRVLPPDIRHVYELLLAAAPRPSTKEEGHD